MPAKQLPTALITGASRGLGRAVAEALAAGGWRIGLGFHENESAAREAAAAVEAAGGEALLKPFDVTDAQATASAVRGLAKEAGRLDALILSAGAVDDRLILRSSRESFERIRAVNLDGAFFCMKAAARAMARRKKGHIVAVASIAALRGRAGGAAYAAAKAGLISLVKSAARELGPSGVSVNAVLPGLLDTDMGRQASEEYREKVRSESVLGRLGDAGEVAGFIRHLISMQGVSGQVFNLDSRIVR